MRRSVAGPRGSSPGGHDPRAAVEVVHVGSACRDLARRSARLAAGWRRDVRGAHDARLGLRTAAFIGVDDAGARCGGARSPPGGGGDLLLVPLTEGPVFHNLETPAGRVQTCRPAGDPAARPGAARAWPAAPAWRSSRSRGRSPSLGGGGPGLRLVAVGGRGSCASRGRGAGDPSTATAVADLERADLVGVSHRDVDPDTPVSRSDPAAPSRGPARRDPGPGRPVVVVGRTRTRIGPPLPITADRRRVDPTGAGRHVPRGARLDRRRTTPSAARRGRRSHPEIRFAAAAGSLVVEGPGLTAVPDRAATLARMVRDGVRRLAEPATADRVGGRLSRSVAGGPAAVTGCPGDAPSAAGAVAG